MWASQEEKQTIRPKRDFQEQQPKGFLLKHPLEINDEWCFVYRVGR